MAGDGNRGMAYEVHVGPWTNWSRGRVLGATLTLTRSDGNLLIAFVAFFLSIIAARFWRVACMGLHYFYSTPAPSDGLHHQRQALLRNMPNPEVGFWTIVDLGRSWRRKALKPWVRLIPLLLLAFFSIAGFALASVFSARVASVTESEVLLSGSKCGFTDLDRLLGKDTLSLFQLVYRPYRARDLLSADNYARQCYATNPAGSLGCDTFVRKQVPTKVTTNASCPFSGNICKNSTANLRLDTGFLDSHEDFGLNTPEEQRFQYRRVVQCAPLTTDGYKSQFNMSAERSYTRYHYGVSTREGQGNFTAQFSNDLYDEYLRVNGSSIQNDYQIRLDSAVVKNGTIDVKHSKYIPIPELQGQDGMVHLFFLSSGGVAFLNPVWDSWYRATQPLAQLYQAHDMHGNMTLYSMDEPGSPLACLEQFQFCFSGFPEGRRCSPLASFSAGRDGLSSFLRDQVKDVGSQWMMNQIMYVTTDVCDPVSILGINSLVSRTKLYRGSQALLPDNQWQIDVQHWHATAMAHLQAQFIYAVTGPRDPALADYFHPPESSMENLLCKSQKIRTTDYISFSVFGLAFIFVLGGAVVLLSLSLDPVLSGLRKHRGFRTYHHLEWASNEVFQLQRLAHEGLGLGTWSRATGSVPITRPGEVLGILDLSDPAHPRLRAVGRSEAGNSQMMERKDTVETVETTEILDDEKRYKEG